MKQRYRIVTILLALLCFSSTFATKAVTLKHSHGISVKMYAGSMQANVTRLAHYFGWQHVKWLPQVDYNWTGTTTMHAANFPTLLGVVLNHYPLQAQFYQGNHVLVITARTLKS